MEKLIKKLPLVGFILAIGAAFAFDAVERNPDPALDIYRPDGSGSYTKVEGSYTCLDGAMTCIVQFENNDVESGQITYEEDGVFTQQ